MHNEQKQERAAHAYILLAVRVHRSVQCSNSHHP